MSPLPIKCLVPLLFPLCAHAGIEEMKASGSLGGYNSLESTHHSTISNPGFVTDDKGQDSTYAPKIDISHARGNPTLDLTNSVGSPAISLSRTTGTNNTINSKIADEAGGGWKVIYNGSGTTAIDPPNGFSNYRIWYKYYQKTDGRYASWVNKFASNINGIGAGFSVAHTDTCKWKSGGDWRSSSVTVTASGSITPRDSRFTVPSNQYRSKRGDSHCYARAEFSSVRITRFEAFY